MSRPASSNSSPIVSSDTGSDARTLQNESQPAPAITVHTRSTEKEKEKEKEKERQAPNYAHVENALPSPANPPFSKWFFERGDPEVAKARMIYVKSYVSGLVLVILTIFGVFSIYWGSLWKVPAHSMRGWIVDFDGGDIGQTVTVELFSRGRQFIRWEVVPPGRFTSADGVIEAVKLDQTWIAVVINVGATTNLQDAIDAPNASYNGSAAITAYGAEARNENAYATQVQTSLDIVKFTYATQLATQLSQSIPAENIVSLLSISPQTIVNPISYTIVNLLPFDQPVASAVVFVGLIYLLILSFFIVMIAYSAREASGIDGMLKLRSLIILRLVSSFFGYFFLSFFYSLLNLAFKLNLTRRYGYWGFIIFWMLNWAGMLSVGLALESLITILTPKFIPFFMILWIIVNVSVCVFPIDILPRIYHYGYGAPFYNISNSIRSIAFETRNTIGLNFGVLFAWILISCMTLPLLQWHVRRKVQCDILRQSSANADALGTARP
ncbi:hypothetical protein BDN70DRAFT_808791 [Pholiota conissans]|uniref:DUF3533 domain-containing protein n=1 Tax=Pholiota conissans TaxID=109636 RepID=A0A9P6CSP0_9AGAR|nr:hypothetical protein BDN70DRAFT_808791 [Pholiota conissans]